MNEFIILLHQYVIEYIDEILIYSAIYTCTTCTYCTNSPPAPPAIHKKAEKCKFHKDTLGYMISQGGEEIDSNKVKAVTDWPRLKPAMISGFANLYRIFILNYSLIASPLTASL